jgi:hypothetical protein
MPTYNVHLYREMRLFFPGIEAGTPEEAVRLVADKATDEAEHTDDCEGATTSALVDLVGDEEYRHSKTIDLDPVKVVAQELYEALEECLRARPAFRLKPIGSLGSHARLEQEAAIAAEDKALAVLEKPEANPYQKPHNQWSRP